MGTSENSTSNNVDSKSLTELLNSIAPDTKKKSISIDQRNNSLERDLLSMQLPECDVSDGLDYLREEIGSIAKREKRSEVLRKMRDIMRILAE